MKERVHGPAPPDVTLMTLLTFPKNVARTNITIETFDDQGVSTGTVTLTGVVPVLIDIAKFM